MTPFDEEIRRLRAEIDAAALPPIPRGRADEAPDSGYSIGQLYLGLATTFEDVRAAMTWLGVGGPVPCPHCFTALPAGARIHPGCLRERLDTIRTILAAHRTVTYSNGGRRLPTSERLADYEREPDYPYFTASRADLN